MSGSDFERLEEEAGEEAIERGKLKKRFPLPAIDMAAPPRPILVVGPSGVGKSTLVDRLLAEHPERFAARVAHTSRPPRPGEVDGKHYHFVSRDEFATSVGRGEFIENVEYGGNRYGTSFESMKTPNKTCLLVIDVQGVALLGARAHFPFRAVFVVPPSLEELERRIRLRGSLGEEQVRDRLAAARRELEFQSTSTLFEVVVINDNPELAYAEFKRFCLQ